MNLILGTAGHIDHGKTALVRALTGIDCDRLEAEKRRGITIELGFAWMDLPDGQRLGIVDVPGHERFVKNMVAGASGIDCALLVIAADEGVMPQTREHVEICSLLCVRAGIVALTKTDLVEPEWLAMVKEEVAATLAGTFLENSPVVPVSSLTGQGLEDLRSAIAKTIGALESGNRIDIFRLPIDRVFTMKGFGTVVTGTVVSGECALGERLCVYPVEKLTRSRSLEVHNQPVESAHAGQRCAINLHSLDVADIDRGDVIARQGTLFPVSSWYVRLTCLKSSPLPIRQRAETHFHHGTAERLAKFVFLDRERLEPGQSAIAKVRFDSPMTAVYGDRFVIRSHSPLRAIGGGIVIDPLPPHLSRRSPDYAEKVALLQELAALAQDRPANLAAREPAALVNLVLKLYPAPGLSLAQMQVLTALPKKVLEGCLEEHACRKQAYKWNSGPDNWIGKDALLACLASCELRARDLHNREPLKGSFASSSLISPWGDNLPEKFVQKFLEYACEMGLLEQQGAGLKLAAHKIALDKDSAHILNLLLERIEQGGRTPPFIRELVEENGWDGKKIQPLIEHLCDCGKLVKIQEGVYFSSGSVSEMIEKIRQWFDAHEELEIGDLKTILGISRKYAIPLLEYLDSLHVTYRAGNRRRLCKGDSS